MVQKSQTTIWDVFETLDKIIGFQLPTSTGGTAGFQPSTVYHWCLCVRVCVGILPWPEFDIGESIEENFSNY